MGLELYIQSLQWPWEVGITAFTFIHEYIEVQSAYVISL